MSTFTSLFSVSDLSAPRPAAPQVSSAAASDPRGRIELAFQAASNQTGLPFDYFLQTAQRESSLDPQAAASTSSARGLFQFIEQTWLSMMHEHGPALGLGEQAAHIERRADGRFQVPNPQARDAVLDLRYDPGVSAMMSGFYVQENAAALESALGRPVTVGEGYVAHVMGAGGAARLISLAETQPSRSAADVFPVQADANRGLFYHRSGGAVSVEQLYTRLTSGFPTDLIEPNTAPPQVASSPSGAPIPLTPPGFADLPQAAAPAPEDVLARHQMFTSNAGESGGAQVPFFAALYNRAGIAPVSLEEEAVATFGSVAPTARVLPPSPIARPDTAPSNPVGAIERPLDLVAFARTGELAQRYEDPSAARTPVDLVPPV